jgi:hypothetical protein
MASLIVKSEEFGGQILELNLGLNKVGRSPKNDFCFDHPSISAFHCEIVLADAQIVVRDCQSTNGTFLEGRAIKQAQLKAGQMLRLGNIELFVESTDVTIAIPKFDRPCPAPPVVLQDGTILCRRHPQATVTHQCTHCRELLCEACLHRLRRRGGHAHNLCPLCSHECERIGGERKKKKGLLGFLRKTVKLPFARDRQ